jgi:hypothetical protein
VLLVAVSLTGTPPPLLSPSLPSSLFPPLVGYEEDSAWPLLLDSYVDYLKVPPSLLPSFPHCFLSLSPSFPPPDTLRPGTEEEEREEGQRQIPSQEKGEEGER